MTTFVLVPGGWRGGCASPRTRWPPSSSGSGWTRPDYVYLSGWDGTPFTAVRDRMANDPAWRIHTLNSGHDICRDAPQEFLKILLLGE